MPEADPFVRFVVVPFLPDDQPALGVSSLLAVLAERGIPGDIRYLNLSYGERIGWDLYREISRTLPSQILLGEMIFTRALWESDAPPWQAYETQLCASDQLFSMQSASREQELAALLVRARALYDEAPQMVEEWAGDLLAGAPTVLGFTTTFQQNIAALALAQQVRRLDPDHQVRILFGGANCEADMGRTLAERFPFIDHVVGGEAEPVIVDLVSSGGDGFPRFVVGQRTDDLDALPYPDFAHYFAEIQDGQIEHQAHLTAESSRGCWWGMKSHCTFCGLNGLGMAYRSKAPERFARELATLVERFGRTDFMMTDNILDLKYLGTVFPDLIRRGLKLSLFYETKSNLRKEQLEMMAAAGVRWIQPGIESLSTPILHLMGKGTTLLQNLQLLRWCEELGIRVSWNLLYGFPHEPQEAYDQMAALMPVLCHLPAPTGYGPIHLDRFSPYWGKASSYGLHDVKPYWSYDHVYEPLDRQARAHLAYFFDFEYDDGRDPRLYSQACREVADAWRRAAELHLTLERVSEGDQEIVLDTRRGSESKVLLSPLDQAILTHLDTATTLDRLVLKAQRHPDLTFVSEAKHEVASKLRQMRDRGWLVEEQGKWLSLVLDRSERNRVVNRRASVFLAQFGLELPDEVAAVELPESVSASQTP